MTIQIPPELNPLIDFYLISGANVNSLVLDTSTNNQNNINQSNNNNNNQKELQDKALQVRKVV